MLEKSGKYDISEKAYFLKEKNIARG